MKEFLIKKIEFNLLKSAFPTSVQIHRVSGFGMNPALELHRNGLP